MDNVSTGKLQILYACAHIVIVIPDILDAIVIKFLQEKTEMYRSLSEDHSGNLCIELPGTGLAQENTPDKLSFVGF